MLQCVEDARMALAATEQDAADLRRQLGQVLTERHDLVAALPGVDFADSDLHPTASCPCQ